MAALVRMILRNLPGCFLPASMVAELELNSVNPSPDMIEEEDEKIEVPQGQFP
jgi:hypothetical protein